jgi:hypothetical protein
MVLPGTVPGSACWNLALDAEIVFLLLQRHALLKGKPQGGATAGRGLKTGRQTIA